MIYRREKINEILSRAEGCISSSDLEGKYSPVYEGEREPSRRAAWESLRLRGKDLRKPSSWKAYRKQQYR